MKFLKFSSEFSALSENLKTLLTNLKVLTRTAPSVKRPYFKKPYFLILIFGLFFINVPEYLNAQIDTELEINGPDKGLHKKSHHDANGKTRHDLYQKSSREYRKMKRFGHTHLSESVTWTQIGPAPANVDRDIRGMVGNGQLPGPNSGAIFDIAIDPSGDEDDIVYIATNNGGIWKTTNGGEIWFPITDTLESLSFGAIALDMNDPNTLYAGTGNAFIGSDESDHAAIGMFVSRDGGASWNAGPDNSPLIGKSIIKMVSIGPGLLYAATNKGLFYSFDYGYTFYETPINTWTGKYISDLDVNMNLNKMWVSIRGRGILQLTFGTAGFTNLWASGNGEIPSTSYGNVTFTVSDNGLAMLANAQLYPSGVGADTSNVGLWRSWDYGNTWENLSDITNTWVDGLVWWRQMSNCQCPYDQFIAIDPSNNNRVYMGFQDLWRSENGGNSWTNVSLRNGTGTDELMHVDQHVIAFSPPNHRTGGEYALKAWVGNDGGIWSTSNNGATWNNRNASVGTIDQSLANNLFRGIDMGRGSTAHNAWVYGGMQDNGSAVRKANQDNIPGAQQYWTEWGGGDGGPTAVDWIDPMKAYGVWGKDLIYTHNGGTTNLRSAIAQEQKYVTSGRPMETGPTDRDVYLGGFWKVSGDTLPTILRSTDFGKNYYPYAHFSVNTIDPDHRKIKNVQSIALTPADSTLMYVSLPNGSVYRINEVNDVPSATNINIPHVIHHQAPQLAIHQENPDMVVAVYQGYSERELPETSRHVFLSQDGGANWKDISGTISNAYIPDIPIHDVVFDPNTSPNSILVASDFGVFRTFDFGITWHQTGTDFPHAHTIDLEIDAFQYPSLIRAGTFGRSTWESYLSVDDLVFGQFLPDPSGIAPVRLLIHNDTDEELLLQSISNNGEATNLVTLSGGGTFSKSNPIYSGVIVARNTDNHIVFVYVVNGNNEQHVTISREVMNQMRSQELDGMPGIRSLPINVPVDYFVFKNNSSQDLTVNFIDSNGVSQFKQAVSHNGIGRVDDISSGQVFTFNNNKGVVVGIFVVSESPNQEMIINDTILNAWD